MERLTEKEMIGDYVSLKKCAEEICVSHCSECELNKEAMKKLKAYEDAEEQGLLVRLPCKYVYYLVDVNSKWGGMVMKKSIKDLSLYEIEQIDKRKYYSTREEAEAALAEMEK